jgi:hypothetical protein
MKLATPREELTQRRFNQRLMEALQVARCGNTAIVIVPCDYPRNQAITVLLHWLDDEHIHNARVASDALHFDGTRGSVRLYPCDHVTYDVKQRRLLDYPAGVPHFLHPEVEDK